MSESESSTSIEKSKSEPKKSSPKRLLLMMSPRRSKSAPSSPNQSPHRRSSLSTIYSPRDMFQCFWCRKKLLIDDNKVLGVKCTCHPSMYFCSKLCHRSHWIDPASGRCDLFDFVKTGKNGVQFSDLDSPITWKEQEYVHDIKDVENTLHFPIKISDMLAIMTELQAFDLNVDITNLMISVSNFNNISYFTLAVIPKSRYKFEFAFISKYELTFPEYNRFLQMCKPYFRTKKIPELITSKLINLQKLEDRN